MSASSVAVATPYVPKRRWFSRDSRFALYYLLPAFIVMGIITFYPLLYQTYMSFTDFGLKNLSHLPNRSWHSVTMDRATSAFCQPTTRVVFASNSL